MFQSVLIKYKTEFYPLLGESFRSEDFCPINLSVDNPELNLEKIQTYDGLDEFIQKELEKNNSKVGLGGYLEKRNLYQPSQNFSSSVENRNIHLGLDWWCEAETPIFAPLDGLIHSFQYNDAHLDYGATIILQHELDGLGNRNENGGWVPHLHFQIIKNMMEKKGDFPGVTSGDDLISFSKNCPDPNLFFNY